MATIIVLIVDIKKNTLILSLIVSLLASLVKFDFFGSFVHFNVFTFRKKKIFGHVVTLNYMGIILPSLS